VFDPSSETSFISGLRWSGDRRLSLWQNASTSNSFAADGVGISLHVVDVETGSDRDLGTTLGFRAWAQWSSDGRLAFVSGGGRGTWHAKQVKVLYPDGRIETVAGDGATHPVPGSRSAIAPAWRPVDRDAALSWIEGPSTDTLSGLDYVAGRGPGERLAVVETTVGHVVAPCPGSVTEGIRWAADGRSAVLLCRTPSVESHALELWYAPLGGTPRRLVTGLGDLGFGYYGAQPSLLEITAWSLADR
jgi:hypothetical protein